MKRSPAAAAWLSLLPGLGHIYLGQAMKGFAFALVAVGLIDLVDRGEGPLGMLIPIYWFFVVLDAYRFAQDINQGSEKGDSQLRSNSIGGAPWFGWALVGLGVLFLLFNFDLIDLDWIWRLWPIALIVIGIRLLRPRSGTTSVSSSTPANPETEEGAGTEELRDDSSDPSTED